MLSLGFKFASDLRSNYRDRSPLLVGKVAVRNKAKAQVLSVIALLVTAKALGQTLGRRELAKVAWEAAYQREQFSEKVIALGRN